jgi:prepilin-type processing-associated H-X9-DG protein
LAFSQSLTPGWSWSALILPYLEQDALARNIDWLLPVDSPSFDALRATPLRMYMCPADRSTGPYQVINRKGEPLLPASTISYAANAGKTWYLMNYPHLCDGVFTVNSRIKIPQITDGSSNTFAIGERASLFVRSPWAGAITGAVIRTTPGAPVFWTVTQPPHIMPLARIFHKPLQDIYAEPYDFFTAHNQTIPFAFCDGSVRDLSVKTHQQVLRAYASRNSGDSLDEGAYAP